MSIALQEAAQFSVQGSRYQRMNADGSTPTSARTVSKTGTFDSDTGLTANAGTLTIKRDATAVVDIAVDFSAAVDTAAVTPAEAVTALTAGILAAALNTDWTASVESGTGVVLIAYTGGGTAPVYTQFYGNVAGVLGIGGTSQLSTLGTKFIKHFTDTTSFARGKNIKDGEEIELEAGDGTLWTIQTDTILKGENLTANLAKDDGAFKELVMGGTWVEGGIGDNFLGKYTPPNTSDTTQPNFRVETFAAKYPQGYQAKADLIGYAWIKHLNCTGMEGDLSNDAKAWAAKAYNIKAFEYIDPVTSVKSSSYEENDISIAQFGTLDPINV